MYGAMSGDFQSFAGPGDRRLPMSEVQGYQPVSRIGEIVMNAFGTRHSPFHFPAHMPTNVEVATMGTLHLTITRPSPLRS